MKAAVLTLMIMTLLASPTLSENLAHDKANEWIDLASGTALEGAGASAGVAWGDCDGDGDGDGRRATATGRRRVSGRRPSCPR